MKAGGRTKGNRRKERMLRKPEREFEMKHEGWQVKTEDKKSENEKKGKNRELYKTRKLKGD